jgi:hypothetical protein
VSEDTDVHPSRARVHLFNYVHVDSLSVAARARVEKAVDVIDGVDAIGVGEAGGEDVE